jgi:tetratricopeptide (TPR) repeat protein
MAWVQAWAILEAQLGPRTRARELFQRAINLDASHTASWHAWAMMEAAAGHVGKARQYFRRASETNPRHLPTLQAWARLEAQQGELAAARVKFQQALTVDSTHIPSWQVQPLPHSTPLMSTSTPTRSCGSLWEHATVRFVRDGSKQGLTQCLVAWTSSKWAHMAHMPPKPSAMTVACAPHAPLCGGDLMHPHDARWAIGVGGMRCVGVGGDGDARG